METCEYPSIAICIEIIAIQLGEDVPTVARALLHQIREHGLDATELIHQQYLTAMQLGEKSDAK